MMPGDAYHASIDAYHRDAHAQIIAYRALRWDIIKWIGTVNLATAAAAVSYKQQYGWFVVYAVLMVLVGGGLTWHTNKRLTGHRHRVRNILQYYVQQTGTDMDPRVVVLREKAPMRSEWHDREELIAYAALLLLSVVPVSIVWWWST
jgi:hypothetical protein